MRTFKEFPQDSKDVCPICKTKDNKECVLIPIAGTGSEPGKKVQNYEALCFHLECICLFYDKPRGIIYQVIDEVVE